MTSDTQKFQNIPLNKLIASPRNVRRKDRKADIDSLAASIASCGLLQNLCVVPGEGDRFEVDAGGRRLMALKKLAKDGVIAKDFPVPCHIVTSEDGREVSLIENIHRVAMDAMDEVDAFAALVAEGATPDDVARRFGVARRHVDQRLALAGLSPKIKAAWKRGDVSLEAARAFCLVESHAQQEAVFRSLGRPVTHAGSVRARLMEGRMRASDRLAKFVGLEAYELAGGAVVRDLFDPEAVYVEDPALMAQLAEKKLEGEHNSWLAQGWGWVENSLGQGRTDSGYAAMRLQPDWREFTDEEEAELARLRGDMGALDTALDNDSVEEDPRWEIRDTIAGAIESLRQSARVWDRELIAHAGVVMSISHDGDAHATLGVVRHSDEKTVKAIRKRQEADDMNGGDVSEEDESSAAETAPMESGLPKTLIRDLSQARTRAIRLLLARDRETALAVTVAAMIARSVFKSELSGIGVAAHAAQVDDLDALVETRSALLAHIPDEADEVLDWCLMQPPETLMSLLAVIVADSIDLVHEKGSPVDRRRQALADRLADILNLDMRQFWEADASYWTRLPKADLLVAFTEAPSPAGQSERSREAIIKAHAKLKKDELAAKVGEAFAGAGYLPDLLVTPVSAGRLELTSAGVAVAAE
ncbi:MAG TPA: ParB/RepB/Spo0J family partition protein [Hyphomonadaceae bacterium]|nr:ParB/RepB/Spo0J family partition protein [Hyphomonadaceae bacterium]